MASAVIGLGLVRADLSAKTGGVTPGHNRASAEDARRYSHQVETVEGCACNFRPERMAPIVHDVSDATSLPLVGC